MRKLFCACVIITLSMISYSKSWAQNYPVYNSYYINPYLYNPAEVATDYTYVYINHRRQWLGVEGAPVVSTINISSQLHESRSGIGAKISSFERGLLNTTDVSLTYAYGVPVSEKNLLYFGLSGGAISTTVNADPADPAVSRYQSNNFQPTGNFGLLYRSASGINLGVALPQLFATASAISFSPVDNMIFSAYYRRKVEGKIVSKTKKGVRSKVKTHESNAPLELYTLYKYSKFGNSQFEVMGKFNLSEHFWLGAFYKQSYGFGAITGIQANHFIFSYAYELGGQPEPGFSSGTHEIQLGIRLGKQKIYKRKAPVLHSLLKAPSTQHVARFQQTIEDTDHVENKEDTKKKYYVVIKAFSDFTGADVFKKKLIAEKYNADIFYYEKDKKYYVHVMESGKSSEAYDEARNLKNFTKLKEAKVLTVIQK